MIGGMDRDRDILKLDVWICFCDVTRWTRDARREMQSASGVGGPDVRRGRGGKFVWSLLVVGRWIVSLLNDKG